MRASPRQLILGLYSSQLTPKMIDAAMTLGVSEIDTASTYHPQGDHAPLGLMLKGIGIKIATKVGFRWDSSRQMWTHTLRRKSIRSQVVRVVSELDLVPSCVYLHNPEMSLKEVDVSRGVDLLGDALGELELAKSQGLIGAWGVATWDPGLVTRYLRQMPRELSANRVMFRCGVLVPEAQRDDAASLISECARSGGVMAVGAQPLGGPSASALIAGADLRALLIGGERTTQAGALFRLAFELPGCKAVAVSTCQPRHLEELVASLQLCVDDKRLQSWLAKLDKARSVGRREVNGL